MGVSLALRPARDPATLARRRSGDARGAACGIAITRFPEITGERTASQSGWYALGSLQRDQTDAPCLITPSEIHVAAGATADGQGQLTEAFYALLYARSGCRRCEHPPASVGALHCGPPEWAARAPWRSPAPSAARAAMRVSRRPARRGARAPALTPHDAESRLRARAANEPGPLAAFKQLDTLPDSPSWRIIRATTARRRGSAH